MLFFLFPTGSLSSKAGTKVTENGIGLMENPVMQGITQI